jgi:predicted ribosome quality control (RQC) complex YloA/Tae2 family protein
MKIKGYSNFYESKSEKFPNIKTLVIDEFTIMIGKDDLSNDYLTTKMANDDDLWFRSEDSDDVSHIIIRVKDKLPSPELIKKVAKLAAPKGSISKIVYCKAKFVKKTSDMKPGQVIVDYINSEEVIVEN